jgi:microcystin-dependent protein
MGILSKIKGFIKLSEVAADSAQTLLDTSVNQDANTVIIQTASALEDALRKQSLLLLSTGNVTWASNKITPDVGVDMTVKLFQNSNGQTINLNLSYANFSSGVSLPNDGDVLYLELNRSLLTSGTISIYNGGGSTGQRAVVGSGMPPLVNNQSGGFQGTICIPIAVRQGTNLWWVPSNFYWATGTVGTLGTPGSTTAVPVGSVFSFAGSVTPTGYLLCNGDIIPNGVGTVQGVTANWSALYAVIGSTYGVAGQLPDMRRRVAMGAGGSGTGTIGNAIGNTGGEENHTLTASELASHTHTGSNQYVRVGPNNVSPPTPGQTFLQYGSVPTWTANWYNSGGGGGTGSPSDKGVFVQGASDDYTQKLPNGASGHNNIQPSLVLNYIIKA